MAEIDWQAEHHFITLAIQYHIAGRAAVSRQLIPIAGNLLHHAIEMALKTLLVADLKLKGVKKLSHKLQRLWKCAIAKHPGLYSQSRAATVEQLDRFESLRYPDSIIENRATTIRFSQTRLPPSPLGYAPFYDLVVDDVDELFNAIFVAVGNPAQGYLALLNQEALATMRDRNKFAIG